jgi:hypothetical protein
MWIEMIKSTKFAIETTKLTEPKQEVTDNSGLLDSKYSI